MDVVDDQPGSGILAYLCSRHPWQRITVGLRNASARHEETDVRDGGRFSPAHRVAGPEPLGLGTHRLWDRSLLLGSAVVEFPAPSTRSGKRALQTPCYARFATGTQDTSSNRSQSRRGAQFSAVLRSPDPRTHWTVRPALRESHRYFRQIRVGDVAGANDSSRELRVLFDELILLTVTMCQLLLMVD